MADYIPEGDDAFLDWVRNFHEVCTEKTADWGLPAALVALIGGKMEHFETALQKCHSRHKTKADTEEKNECREDLEAECRSFSQEFLMHSSNLTRADRVRAGLHVPDPNQTPPPKPVSWPVCEVELTATGEIVLKYTDSGTEKKARPRGVRGAEIILVTVAPGGPAPTADADFTRSEFSDVSPKTIRCDLADRNKTLYFRARWEVSDEKKGPWSPVYSTVVP
jgi:hypothetical protein